MVLAFNTTFLFMASKAQSLEALQEPGYSPPEQYTPRGKHGPWSDVYSCAATLYTMLTGYILPDAAARLRQDEVPHIINSSEGFPEELKNVLIQSLSLSTNKRPQSIEHFSTILADSLAMPGVVSAPPSEEAPPQSLSKPPADFQSSSLMGPADVRLAHQPKPAPPVASPFDSPFSEIAPRRDASYPKKISFDEIYTNGHDATAHSNNGSTLWRVLFLRQPLRITLPVMRQILNQA